MPPAPLHSRVLGRGNPPPPRQPGEALAKPTASLSFLGAGVFSGS